MGALQSNIMLIYGSIITSLIAGVYSSPLAILEAAPPPATLCSRDSLTNSTLSASTLSPRDDFGLAFASFAALGDSYASGLGAGRALDRTCRRYDHSYPYLLNNDPRLGDHQGDRRRFQPLTCTGARISDVIEKQVPQLTSDFDLITVTAGGNDVGFGKIVDTCIFGFVGSSCDSKVSEGRIYTDNVLPGALDMLLHHLTSKLTPRGRVYITGYAKFFNANTNQCNFASLAILGKRTLDHYRRQVYNDLIDVVNVRIEEAAERAGSQVTFVNYDPYFGQCKGRICEEGVFEPNAHRVRLLFFERGSTDMDVRDGNPWPIIKRRIHGGGDSWFRLPDSDLRTFHPRSTGHRIITEAILAHMHRDKALEVGHETPTLDTISCPIRGTL